MFITKRFIPRRAMLRGMGATIALPFLEAMVPAATLLSKTAASGPIRLTCIEMVHGSAGSTVKGAAKNLWAPADVGKHFDLTPSSLSPLEPIRNYLTIVSNTDVPSAGSIDAEKDAGGDHARSSAAFLTQSPPKKTEGADIFVGTSMDQLVADRFGHLTPIPSLQLCIEDVGRGSSGYASIYMDTISWASATRPLPMVRDPRVVFDQMYGSGATPQRRLSILDFVKNEIARLSRDLGAADRNRLNAYLENVREVERRIQKIETFNKRGETYATTSAPGAVSEDFEEHVKLMFDLQVQAFTSDLTRVVAFKMGRDASSRVYPARGVTQPFHAASHHAEREDKIAQFARINKYHVGLVLYFLEKLKNTNDADGNLLDKAIVLYGSPMGNSNLHNHKRCPLFLAGLANGVLQGNRHVKAADGASMANVILTLLHILGCDNLPSFGDSTNPFALG